jgi:hypothetical protein
MSLPCPRCGRVLEYSGEPPLFCGYCGSRLKLAATVDFDHEAETVAPREASAASAEVPEQVGGYRLLRPLGEGGMGKVYEAKDIASGRHVALKLIAPNFATSPETVERFRQEGRLASAIAHPRCVFVLAADEEAGRPYIVMELMPGDTLETLVQKLGPLPPEDALAKILDVIEGLQEAHGLGVVHRDIKPSNCFLEADRRVKVGDFGLAKSLVNQAHLTRTGTFLGTLLYCSPEQVRGERVDPQSDVYSVAATLYYLLTGKAPFQTGDAAATLARIVSDPAPSMRGLRPDLLPALDRAVLRGLERDRARRYHDLEEFRQALLPFVPGRLSIGGLGIRFGALWLDYLIYYFLSLPIVLPLSLGAIQEATNLEYLLQFHPEQLVGLLLPLLYYTIPEGLWGWSPAKRLLGLRVWTARGCDPPGVLRALLRAGTFFALLGMGVPVWGLLWFGFLGRQNSSPQALLLYVNLMNFIVLSGGAAGTLLLVSTMRARNGYRGLHEFVSGTRVVQLPRPRKRRTFRPPAPPLERRPEQPERLGPYAVQGAVRWTDREKVLLGEEPALNRPVWLWLRPADEAPLPGEREEIGRAARPRWLAAGRHQDWRWDAFLASPGGTLPDLVRQEGWLLWRDARPILEQLTDELAAAGDEETLPAALTAEQVWVQPNGSVQLLDFALGREPAVTSAPAPDGPDQQRALALLGAVTAWLLEGRPRPAPDVGAAPLRARVPEHAGRFLRRLLTPGQPYRNVKELQAELRATQDRPVEVTRVRRAGQLAAWLGLVCLGPCWCLIGGALQPLSASLNLLVLIRLQEQAREAVQRDATVAFAASLLDPHPLVKVQAVQQWQQDQYLQGALDTTLQANRQRLDVRLASTSGPGRVVLLGWLRPITDKNLPMYWQMIRQRHPSRAAEFRRDAAVVAYVDQRPGEAQGMFITAAGMLVLWPVVWVVWAFGWRGGLSYRLTSIAVVRADGRPASRLQCAVRTFLTWLPITALFVLSVGAESAFWQDPVQPGAEVLPWVCWCSWWAGIVLLLLYVVHAFRSPGRCWNDRLAGTYLVPR